MAAAVFFAPIPARADHTASLGLDAGTPGLGLTLGLNFGKTIGVRVVDQSLGSVSSSFTSFSSSVNTDDNAYATAVNVRAVSALVDYHPFGDNFTFTVGAMQPDINLQAALVASGTQTYSGFLGGQPVTFGAGASVYGSLKWNQTAPYVGIGYQPLKVHHHFGLGMDVGAAFIGAPQTTLQASGTFSVNSLGLAADLATEKESLEQSTRDLDIYPVATATFYYTF
ncbi:MAG TPA: hypothetical protein VME66_04755 [Candidatus Acidoferrales bacterium]|nr:hypothetical protein [Candidatus Acidoferrales bacterium]